MPSKAQDFLNNLIAQRKLRKFCRDNNFKSHAYLYQVAKGTRRPSFEVINYFRDVISPDDWFTDEK